MNNKSVSIITLGCKVNLYESECIYKLLKDKGFSCSFDIEKTDYYVINSCAVTNEAEHKSRKMIASILKVNPEAKIYVIGCSSAINPLPYLEKPNVLAVFGTESKLDVVNAIENDLTGNFVVEPQKDYTNSTAQTSKTRSTIKIQDGCNNFCSYCIIPYTRGRERSRTIEDIDTEISIHAKESKEIVLVGINVAGYGKDLSPQKDLSDVVKLFKKYPKTRFRFSSLEMGSITPKVLKELIKQPNFCPFFHLSLQSASDNVLSKMNRKYTFEQFKQNADEILKVFPSAMISTDIIVGFPTETDEDFLTTLENVRRIPFGNIHVFPYSQRKGTVAARYPILDGKVVSKRAKELRELANELKTAYLNSQTGREEEVLIETQKGNYFCGFTKNYIKCYCPCKNLKLNQIYKIKLTEIFQDGMKGEIIYE